MKKNYLNTKIIFLNSNITRKSRKEKSSSSEPLSSSSNSINELDFKYRPDNYIS